MKKILLVLLLGGCVVRPVPAPEPEPQPTPQPKPVPVPDPIPDPAPVPHSEIAVLSPSDSWTKIKSTIEGAREGAIIVLKPGVYKAQGTIALRGKGATIKGPATWDGAAVRTRDCFQVYGTDYVFESLTIQGCQSGSAAAIRTLETAKRVTIRSCELLKNAQGVTGMGEDVLIEQNHIHDNNNRDSHLGHGIYAYGGSVVIRQNNIHNHSSQNIHNRAREALIEGNNFAAAGSYLGDSMPCAYACGSEPLKMHHVWRGNTIDLGQQANRSQVIAMYYDQPVQDGSAKTVSMTVELEGNKITGNGQYSALVVLYNSGGSTNVSFRGNTVTGVKQLVRVENPGKANWSCTLDGNRCP